MVYAHTNRKGEKYFLNAKEVRLRNGRAQRIFYFSRDERHDTGLLHVPHGFEVSESQTSAMPVLRKKAASTAAPKARTAKAK